jgi:hypothetical protein
VNKELEILCNEAGLCGFGRIRLEKVKKTKKLSRVANFLFEIYRSKLGKKNCTLQYLYCRLLNSENGLCWKMPFQFRIQIHYVSSEELLEI